MGGLISISRPNMLLLSLLIPFLTFTIKVTTAKEDTWLLLHWRVTRKALELPVLFSFSFSSVFLEGLTKVIWVISFYFCFRSVWSIWDLLTWFSYAFKSRALEITGMADISDSISNLALQQLKNILSPILQCIWAPNLLRKWLTMSDSYQ